MPIEITAACALILVLTIAVIGGSFALWIFARTMFFVVQSLGFVRAMENQARTNFAYDVADRTISQPDRKPQVEMFDDDALAKAARASRAATGPAYIEGYVEPPPAAGDARIGAEIDGEEDQAPFPDGGLYAESARR
jgi:hypothetical protein